MCAIYCYEKSALWGAGFVLVIIGEFLLSETIQALFIAGVLLCSRKKLENN